MASTLRRRPGSGPFAVPSQAGGMGRFVLAVLTAGLLASSAAAAPLKVCMLSGAKLYGSEVSLPKYKTWLETNYDVRCTILQASEDKTDMPGLEALDDCDVVLVFTRRLKITGDQLERIKRHARSAKPIVAVRTASHGFQNWLAFDKEILGGNYSGHFKAGPTARLTPAQGAARHPIMTGIDAFKSRYSVYRTGPIAEDCTLLMVASTPASKGTHPALWTRESRRGRVVYCAFGGVEDFQNATFRRLIANALGWAAKRELKSRPQPKPPEPPAPTGSLTLRLRARLQPFKGVDDWEVTSLTREVPVAKTAIVICDMWDKHWCNGATKRVDAIAQRMAPVVDKARAAGVRIIHAPSETLSFYADWPQRRRMLLGPRIEPPEPLDLPKRKLPIDDSDGGCDTGQKPWYSAWTRQHPAITIGPFDGISDDGRRIYSFFKARGIDTMILMGVHTNMCVLGRSFGIRQMTRWGIRCVLVRDLTDAMYNPTMPPQVSHDEGTRLVVEHIEAYWCPTITSDDLVTGLPK